VQAIGGVLSTFGLAAQCQDSRERLIDVLQFIAFKQTVRLSQTTRVDRTNLFDEHPRGRPIDFYFWPKGCRQSVT
jgi:hypothetical protein